MSNSSLFFLMGGGAKVLVVLIVVGIIALIVISVLYNLYVTVVRNKNTALEALSGIDVQLRKRYDLIPNMLTIAKKFMEHETEIFQKITELRSQAMKASLGSKSKFEAEAQLDTQLRALMVNVENYPTLKSDATMVQAMKAYEEVEENISSARRFYNSALTQLRNSIQIFPGSLFRGCAGEVANYSYFETDAASKQPVNAGQFL